MRESSKSTARWRKLGAMRYRVKNEDGELSFGSFGEVERAYLQGLVEPDDEILEEGSTRWRKASTIPLLVQAGRRRNAWGGTQSLWIVVAVVFGSAALYMIAKGRMLIGLVLALILSVLLFSVTYRAFRRTRF